MTKFSVGPVISDHLGTLEDERTHTARWQDWAMLYGLPAAAGAPLAIWNVQLQGIGEVVGGLAILAGFLFGLVVFVFQLRLQVTADPRVAPQGLLPRLLDQLFANVSYAVLVGFMTVGVSIAASATRSLDAKTGDLMAVNRWWSAVLVLLFAHLMLLLAMSLKRLRRAYQELKR
ncbi:hypothetical protein SAMN05660748_4490 [Blastococcus aggregatus]|uniref:Uncharacterized protein n=1 Tax=Blastococcus aggregatus TaxID=38502 RepID=A0A285VHR8_9ACTN|nr:hypothetical protein [Blastococcus aggregatus]SOC53543.1 hypothetical protein SAMN05660748_4490 [Blastococcus aggregatus]